MDYRRIPTPRKRPMCLHIRILCPLSLRSCGATNCLRARWGLASGVETYGILAIVSRLHVIAID